LGNLSDAFVLIFAVIMSLGLGVFAAYAAVIGVLNSFGTQSSEPVAVLVASHSPVSGD